MVSDLAPAGRPLTLERYMALLLSSIFYAFSIKFVLSGYAAPYWPVFSFVYDPPTPRGYLFAFAALASMALVLPKRYDRPSYFILSFTYFFVIVPIVVATICMETYARHNYYAVATVSCLAFALTCVLNEQFIDPRDEAAPVRSAHPLFPVLLLCGSAVLAGYLYYRFGSVMSLVGLDSLYTQRARGAAASLADGYAQTYSQYVFSTALVAYGCYKRNAAFIVAGFLGSILNFSITAEKAGFMFPLFVAALYVLMGRRLEFFRTNSFYMLTFGVVNFISTLLFSHSEALEVICINFGVRTTVLPGVFTLHYYDFFVERGFTYFSHIRGIDFFVPTPTAYAGDVRWPSLGTIVGEDYIGQPELNANTNFVAYDGIAGLGVWGIWVPFAVLLLIVRVFDKLCAGIPTRLTLPLLVPVALTLSNASVFTDLTSFGGFFWMLVFATVFVPAARVREHGPTCRTIAAPE